MIKSTIRIYNRSLHLPRNHTLKSHLFAALQLNGAMSCSFQHCVNPADLNKYRHYWTWPEKITDFDWSNHMSRDVFIERLDSILLNKPPLIERSFKALSENPANSTKCFSVMQWNILAQGLCSGKDNFVRCKQGELEWDNRRLYILQEILKVDADVICLQEVDHFGFLYPAFRSIGYEGFFFPKPDSPALYVDDSHGPDGCAMFYRTSKFKLIRHENIVLQTSEKIYTNQVSVILHLKVVGTNQEIAVATTHLKAKYNWDRLRYEQGKYLIDYLKNNYEHIPIVLCGDFNADPDEKIYGTIKESDLNVGSAYCLLSEDKNTEPPYTTWKIRGLNGGREADVCRSIDYMWYTASSLEVKSLLQIPTAEAIGKNRLPSANYPSDHLSLAAHFELIRDG